MQTLNLDLGDRSYPIYIGDGLLTQAELLTSHIADKQVLIVTNETIAPLYLEQVQQHLGAYQVNQVILPDGEQYKNLDTVNLIYDKLLQQAFNRRTTLIALGGGVVGDITGFAAATYQRGIHFIQIPTTLLAQVDSSVGGKTGVNHALGKNMIGAFHQPRCVIADINTLNTLEDRQLKAGIAEVIKYGLIRDPDFFMWLQENIKGLLSLDPQDLIYAVLTSCRHKADVVAADELESGQRALLNLGHTFGHAIENQLGYGEWLHGEAVSIGMLMAADLSRRLGYINQQQQDIIQQLFIDSGLPTKAPTTLTTEQYLTSMSVDKKVIAGKIRLILMNGWCKAFVTDQFDHQHLIDTLNAF
jgi:3-dehydroquinate synthase